MRLFTTERAMGLQRAVADAVSPWPWVTERRTFGCPSFYVDGRLFAVVSDQGLSFTSLPREMRDTLAVRYPIAPFVANDRPVAGWATVDVGPDEVGSVLASLRASYDHAGGISEVA
jgi:hypothetical protein